MEKTPSSEGVFVLGGGAVAKRVLSAAKQAERDRIEDEWVQRELAKAPPLTVIQTQMLRRVKADLICLAQERRT
jgi:hypothetical protein